MRKCLHYGLGFGFPALTVLVGALWIAVVVQKAAARPSARAAIFTDAEVATHEGMLASIGTAEIEAADHVSESGIVELTAAALQGLMGWDNDWQEGFEDYLRTVLEMPEQEVVLAVYGVYANRAVLLANVTLAELGL